MTLAKHLHSLGFTVFAGCLLADQSGDGATELRAVDSPNLHVLQLDVTKDEDWAAAVALVAEKSPSGLWGIVNNAGWATFGHVEWTALETYDKIVDINVMGVIKGVKACLPLIRCGRGRVVTVTSCLARWAVPNRSPYITTKFALEGFSECLRHEVKRFGVKVKE